MYTRELRELYEGCRSLRQFEQEPVSDEIMQSIMENVRIMSCAKNAQLERGIGAEDAWVLLSRCSLAFKRRDFDGARAQLRRLVENYPHAVVNLADQREFPEGVFARLAVAPGSEDELMLAISEGTVLLMDGRYPFGAWVEEEARKLATPQDLRELAYERRNAR